ncbi:MAG: BadF/BadG/BcrA/BcrD ATPase family protein [Micropruina sp.]
MAVRVTSPRPRIPGGHLAVDAGQSSISISWSDGHHRLVGTMPGVHTDRPLMPQLASAVTGFLDSEGVSAIAVGLGVSGLVTPEAEELLRLLRRTSITEIAIAHDSTTAYLGALGNHPGVVCACGTGVVTLALGETEVARVDGWGHIMGDAGSAYWIGRNALEAAMRGYDGRRQMTALTDVVIADFPDVEGAYMALQADPNRIARIARYARHVDRLAATDRVAANILDKAAAHLSEAVIAAARRAGLMGHEPPRVCAVGEVFNSERVLHKFTDYLTLQWPNFAVTPPQGTPLDGAAMLVDLDSASPMASRVARARR